MKLKPSLRSFLYLASTSLLSISYAHAADATWNVNAAGNWATDGSWDPAAAPGDTTGTTSTDIATFGTIINAARIVTVDVDRNIGGINFAGNSFAYTLNSGNILLTDGGTIQTSGAGSGHTDTIATSIAIQGDGGSASFTGGSSTASRLLVLSGNITGVSTGTNVTTLNLNGTNTGNNAVNGDIGDGAGGGELALVKSGAGRWNLGGINNTYSGGTTISGGRLAVASDGSLGATSGGITFTGATGSMFLTSGMTLHADRTITSESAAMAIFARDNVNNAGTFGVAGQLTGAGGFQFSNGYQLGSGTFNITSLNNNFQGTFRLGGDFSGANQFTPSNLTVNIASLTDAAGYGNIQFGRNNGGANDTITLAYSAAATSALELNNRRIELDHAAGRAQITNNNTTYGIEINTDLLVSRSGNKTLILNAAASSINNVFAGSIANGTGAVISLQKSGTGTWLLRGTNTYTGNTFMNTGSGTLIFQGTQSAPTGGTITLNQLSSSTSAVRLLADGAGTNTFATTIAFDNRNASTGIGFLVGNTGAANGGTGGGTTTGATIAVDKFSFIANQGAAGGTNGPSSIIINNGYTLEVGSVQFAATSNIANSWNIQLAPVGGAMLVTGTVQQDSGQTVSGKNVILKLDGTSTGNIISGNILDAADFGVNGFATALSVNKANTAGDWTLTGTNAYTGNTTISGGRLEIGGAGTLGSGSYAGTISIASTNSGNLTVNSTANQTLDGVISGAGALVKDNSGNLTLTNANTYTGATTVNGGTLNIASGGSTHASSAVTVSNSGSALIVNGTVNGTLLANTSTTLSGSGTVVGAAAIHGNLTPGNGPGVLSFSSSLTMSSTTATTMEINGTTLGLNYDNIDTNGALTYDGALTLALGATFGGGSYTFDLFDIATQSGSFDSVALSGTYGIVSLANNGFGVWGATTNSGNETWTFTQSTGDLSLVVIPEPRAALLGGIGLLMLLRRRR